MSVPLRVAVIGAGQIAQRGHFPGLLVAGAKIAAVCDNQLPNLDEVAARFQIERTYRDWRGMLTAGGFEAVTICTPPFLHAEMSVECARMGYHVLVEKPMAVSLEQCDQMTAAAQAAGVILMISHNQRFMPSHRLAKEILDSGVLGKPYLVHAVFGHSGPEVWSPAQEWYFVKERAGQGVIVDLGYHKVDLVRWITGQEVVQVSAFCNTFEKNTSLEDSAIFALQLSGGSLCTIHASWVFRPDWENSLVIRCARGVISIPTESSQPVHVLRFMDAGESMESTYLYKPEDADPSGWNGAMKSFVGTILSKAASPVPGSEGKATLTAILAAVQSVKQQKIISISQV
jgi:UDP-N-acetylglucosamine 3-dehydrogenase